MHRQMVLLALIFSSLLVLLVYLVFFPSLFPVLSLLSIFYIKLFPIHFALNEIVSDHRGS